jgi:ABC-2 type transport system permease protein
MNVNLYTKELKRNGKNFVIWSAIVAAFTTMVATIYPAMEPMGANISELLRGLPKEMREVFGISENSWSNMLSFYSIYYGFYLIMLSTIYTTSTGATILTKEERDRTAEFLMTRPITRNQVYWTKMMSLATITLGFVAVQYLVAVLSLVVSGKGEFSWYDFHAMHIHGAALMVFFTGLGVFVSMVVSARSNFMGVAVGLVFGSYIVEALSKAVDRISWLGYISPFHYADFESSSPAFEFEPVNTVAFILGGALCVVAGKRLFVRKEFMA